MLIPSNDDIVALHRRFAPTREVFDLVYTHCRVVAAVAAQLLANRPQDLEADLVRAGCLLHDIGVYRLYDAEGRPDGGSYLRHGVLGDELLAGLDFPPVLRRFCSHHTGVGLTRADVIGQGLPIPPADYLAETAEERLVMYADKFHSKSTPPRFLTVASYRDRIARFGADKAVAFDGLVDEFGVPDLAPLVAEFGHAVR